MNATQLQTRITVTEQLIAQYEGALLALEDPSIFSYTIDSGQSKQTVTRNSIGQLNKSLEILYNRLTFLNSRLTGGGAVVVQPVC